MSFAKETGWFTPLMIVLVGGLAWYGMARGPGCCPANTSRPVTTAAVDGASTSTSTASDWGSLMHGDDSNFDAVVLQADVPVLVDFYADWCGPCQELAPVLDRVAEDLTEGRIVKVNVDQSPRITARYNIQTIPTMLVFVNGQVVDRAMGLKSEADLRRLLQR